MKKEHIIPIVLLILFIGGMGAVYKFYFKEQLERYSQNVEALNRIEQKLAALENTFKGKNNLPVTPQAALEQWRGSVQPWAEAIARRAPFYNIPIEYERVPEGIVPKFYYRDKFREMFQDLQREVAARGVYIPQGTFGVPTPEDLQNQPATAEAVNLWLERITFARNMLTMLMDAKAWQIQAMEIWPVYEQYGMLEKQTVGLHLRMYFRDLVAFLEDLYNQDRYFSVDALSIENPSLTTSYDPMLTVRLLLTQARLKEDMGVILAAAAPLTAAPTGGAGGGDAVLTQLQGMGPRINVEREAPPPRKKSFWQKIWPF